MYCDLQFSFFSHSLLFTFIAGKFHNCTSTINDIFQVTSYEAEIDKFYCIVVTIFLSL